MNYLTYSSRLEHVLECIRRGGLMSPHQLAEKFNCSEKTVRRMINYLRMIGYEIDYCRKSKKYFLRKITRTRSVRELI